MNMKVELAQGHNWCLLLMLGYSKVVGDYSAVLHSAFIWEFVPSEAVICIFGWYISL